MEISIVKERLEQCCQIIARTIVFIKFKLQILSPCLHKNNDRKAKLALRLIVFFSFRFFFFNSYQSETMKM